MRAYPSSSLFLRCLVVGFSIFLPSLVASTLMLNSRAATFETRDGGIIRGLFRATHENHYLDDAKRYAKLAAAESWMGKEQAGHYQTVETVPPTSSKRSIRAHFARP